MNEKELVSIIITIADEEWKNWGFLIMVNLAVIGWLTQRLGLYTILEKIFASVGYSIVTGLVIFGMYEAHYKLDKAANELAYYYSTESDTPKKLVPNGIIEEFIYKSPEYCSKLIYNKSSVHTCSSFSDRTIWLNALIIIGWLIVMTLFWVDRIWQTVRDLNIKGVVLRT